MITNIFKIKNETLYTHSVRKYRVTEGCTEPVQDRKTSAWGKWRNRQQNISGVWKDKPLWLQIIKLLSCRGNFSPKLETPELSRTLPPQHQLEDSEVLGSSAVKRYGPLK